MVTSMLPIALLPMLGILGSEDTCRSYFKDTTIVMMGGIIIAMAVEYSNLHYRLALLIIKRFTCYPRVLHLALMGITFCLSTTMSNTATAALMSPIVRAILENLNDEEVMKIYLEMEKNDSNENRRPTPQAIAFYLGVAYSATIGGLIFEVIMLSMFLTAFGSNVSIVDQSFGFLAEASLNVKKHPLILFYPAVLASSMAFHLPVSTPPNAIACGFGNIKTKDIIYAGIGPTLSAILLLEIFVFIGRK
uniref:Citrate transporter-like domain-containing protein n=1 Tax=Megaselia scalaris TaxID=36166 RepID=T1GVC5_MEGSC